MNSTIVLALAATLSGSLAAYAQSESTTVQHRHHYYPPHHVAPHRHHVARDQAIVPVAPPVAVAAPLEGAAQNVPPSQMFKPYAEPGDGDDDGLSRDPDDCMKGCIGGPAQ